MTDRLKLVAIGDGVGVVLPKAFLERLRMHEGDELLFRETPDGGNLATSEQEFARQLEVAAGVMSRRRDLLRKLAE